jgi:hypothetical protein
VLTPGDLARRNKALDKAAKKYGSGDLVVFAILRCLEEVATATDQEIWEAMKRAGWTITPKRFGRRVTEARNHALFLAFRDEDDSPEGYARLKDAIGVHVRLRQAGMSEKEARHIVADAFKVTLMEPDEGVE